MDIIIIIIESLLNSCIGCWNLGKTDSCNNKELTNSLKEEIVEVHFNQIYRDNN